jgi:hypothetical protein
MREHVINRDAVSQFDESDKIARVCAVPLDPILIGPQSFDTVRIAP